MQTVWKTEVSYTAKKDKVASVYEFDNIPSDGIYRVFFASVLLDERDYKIENNKLIFVNSAPLEKEIGYPIEIHYVGNEKHFKKLEAIRMSSIEGDME